MWWRFFPLWSLCHVARAMLHKRALGDLSHIPAPKRLRADALDLFLGNEISGMRTARLFHHARLAGASHTGELGSENPNSHAARNLIRRTLKFTKWPQLYYAKIRGFSRTEAKEQSFTLAMALPHELLHCFLQLNDKAKLLEDQQKELRPDLVEHLQQIAVQFHIQDPLLLGLWCDGVPFNSDRSHTLEVLAMNIVGQGGLRLPLTCFPKAFQAKGSTWDDIYEIIRWSFRCCLTGLMPSKRHDGTPSGKTDVWRKKRL